MVAPKLWWDSRDSTAFGGGVQGTQAAYKQSRSIMMEMKLSGINLTKWDISGSTNDTILCVVIFAPDANTLQVVSMAAGPAANQLVNGFMSRIKRFTRID
jgi:hypothetical protein